MTTNAVLWVICVMTGYPGWRPTPKTKRQEARATPRVPHRAGRRVTGDQPGPSRCGGPASLDSDYARGGGELTAIHLPRLGAAGSPAGAPEVDPASKICA